MGGLQQLRRLLWALPTLFGVLLVVFVLLRVAPGDPIAMMIGPGATPDDVQALRALYGFDRSVPAQFVDLPAGRPPAATSAVDHVEAPVLDADRARTCR